MSKLNLPMERIWNNGNLFFLFFSIRLLFVLIAGIDNHYSFVLDGTWLVSLGDRIAAGNFDLDIGRFIASPAFPFFVAVHKILFGGHWALFLSLSQLILSSVSGIYFYKLARLLFSVRAANIAVLLYAVFPLTMYYVNTFSQETLFQCLLIIFLYYLVKGVFTQKAVDVILSAVLFALCYLTKSHILLFSVFIPVYFLINIPDKKRAVTFSVIYGCVCMVITSPWTLYNLKTQDVFTISSNGGKCLFYFGNTDAAYRSIVDLPKEGTNDYELMKTRAYMLNRDTLRADSIFHLPQKVIQDAFFRDAVQWIKTEPKKFIELKVYDLFFFLLPGVSFRHYHFVPWLLSFLVSAPVYILGYMGIFYCLKKQFKIHFFSLALFITMLLFSLIFYVQNRFRTITIEPVYLLYAGFALEAVVHYFRFSPKSSE
jgi:hypothetical protein